MRRAPKFRREGSRDRPATGYFVQFRHHEFRLSAMDRDGDIEAGRWMIYHAPPQGIPRDADGWPIWPPLVEGKTTGGAGYVRGLADAKELVLNCCNAIVARAVLPDNVIPFPSRMTREAFDRGEWRAWL